jgi:hypothetical protein
VSGWSYEMFSNNDFQEFNRKLKGALDSMVNAGLVPSVSYSHAVTPTGTSYSAIILGVPPSNSVAAPPQDG